MSASLRRKAYPSDVGGEEWAFVTPYPTLMNEDAGQRQYPLRDLFDALRWQEVTGQSVELACVDQGYTG